MKPNKLRQQLRRGDFPGIPDTVRQEMLEIIERVYQQAARLEWLGDKQAATVTANKERQARELAGGFATGQAVSWVAGMGRRTKPGEVM